MPLPDIIRRSGTRMVTLIREPGPTEQRSEVEASILNDQRDRQGLRGDGNSCL